MTMHPDEHTLCLSYDGRCFCLCRHDLVRGSYRGIYRSLKNHPLVISFAHPQQMQDNRYSDTHAQLSVCFFVSLPAPTLDDTLLKPILDKLQGLRTLDFSGSDALHMFAVERVCDCMSCFDSKWCKAIKQCIFSFVL